MMGSLLSQGELLLECGQLAFEAGSGGRGKVVQVEAGPSGSPMHPALFVHVQQL